MKIALKTKVSFASLPRDYAGLCRVLPPRAIRDETDFANITEITDAMAGYAEKFSEDQEDYFDLLCVLIETWEAGKVKWSKVTPLQTLQHLLGEHGMNGADLARVLDVHLTLGPMILGGERPITAARARNLGRHL